jgi:predicted MFS family arabinose efflux permease
VGRRRHVVLVMLASAAVGVAVGFSGTQSAALVIVLWLVYGALAMADSSAVTGGTVGEAEPQLRGTTMAVHSCIGFSGSFLGPLAMGLVLDATGAGKTLASWGAAFSLVAGVSLLGALLLLTLTLRQRRAA